MIPMWMLPVLVVLLCAAAARMTVWCCDPMNSSAADLWLSPKRRRARDDQELRDVDAWLQLMREQ